MCEIFLQHGFKKYVFYKKSSIPNIGHLSSLAIVSGARLIATFSNQFNRAEKVQNENFGSGNCLFVTMVIYFKKIYLIINVSFVHLATKRQIYMNGSNFWLVI